MEAMPRPRDPTLFIVAGGSGLMVLGAVLVTLAIVLGIAGGIDPDREFRSLAGIGVILLVVGNPLFLLGLHRDCRQRTRERAELRARMWDAYRGERNP